MRATREQVVNAARGWIGTPYRHQAALKGVGCDCLGLIVGVWRELGGKNVGSMPPYTSDWAEAMGRETLAEGLCGHLTEIEPSQAAAGDIVLFRWRAHLPAKHAGILSEENRMVHAQEGVSVSEVPLNDWWRRRMAYAYSFGHQTSPPHGERVAAKQLREGFRGKRRNALPCPQAGGE
jgi:NlpC/P60 family putative phage cell wall peptidase